MERYSPEARELLAKWNCMTKNMQSALLRFHQLGRRAEKAGPDALRRLNRLYREEGLGELYEEIGRRLRRVSETEGVENLLPEPGETSGTGGFASFVDFRIGEEALPEFARCIDEMNELIIKLAVKLYLLRL